MIGEDPLVSEVLQRLTGPDWGTCEVCWLVSGDKSIKIVTFCPSCRAWMCDACKRNPLKRGFAALLRKVRNL